MDKIISILTSTVAKRFYWTTFAGFLGLVAVYVSGIDSIYTPIIIAIIAGATKEINSKYGNPS